MTTLSVAGVLRALELAGTALPAFKALFDQVLGTFSEQDQDRLKQAYEAARQRSDAAHGGVQDAGGAGR